MKERPISGKKNAKQCKRLSLVCWMEIWSRARTSAPRASLPTTPTASRIERMYESGNHIKQR